jgi:enolase
MSDVIREVRAREIINEKGIPTVEVDVILEDGSLGRAAAPGGTSRGEFEPADLRDGDPTYFNGLGVHGAVGNVKGEIAPALKGRRATDQAEVDYAMIELDGTPDRSRLGSNAIIATSLANAKAAAASLGIPLFQHFGGGAQIPLCFVYMMFSGPAYVGLEGVCDFQEFALLPLFAKSYKEGYIAASKIYTRLARLQARRTGSGVPNIKDVAGTLIARFDSNEEALAELTRLIEAEGYVPGEDIGIYLDIAANQFYRKDHYHLQADGEALTADQMIDKLESQCASYPILSIEDPLYEGDWDSWVKLTKRIGGRVQIVGDDLFVTQQGRLRKGVEMGAANALVIKPNQVGTLTETFETIRLAKESGYNTIISPRSGELWDPYIPHLCVGQALGQGKIVGAYSGGEASLNELMRIEDWLGESAIYRGGQVLAKFLG